MWRRRLAGLKTVVHKIELQLSLPCLNEYYSSLVSWSELCWFWLKRSLLIWGRLILVHTPTRNLTWGILIICRPQFKRHTLIWREFNQCNVGFSSKDDAFSDGQNIFSNKGALSSEWVEFYNERKFSQQIEWRWKLLTICDPASSDVSSCEFNSKTSALLSSHMIWHNGIQTMAPCSEPFWVR